MSEALKERKENGPAVPVGPDQNVRQRCGMGKKAFLPPLTPKLKLWLTWEGKLNNAASIREFMMQKSACSVNWENLAVYTSLRLSEDTRADDAQSMDAALPPNM